MRISAAFSLILDTHRKHAAVAVYYPPGFVTCRAQKPACAVCLAVRTVYRFCLLDRSVAEKVQCMGVNEH